MLQDVKIRAIITLVLLVISAAIAGVREHDMRIRREALLTDQMRRSAVDAAYWQQQAASATTKVLHDSITVSKTVHRLDTLWREIPAAIITHADTVRVIESLPAIRSAVDSEVRACTELQSSCAAMRVTKDSVIAFVTRQRDLYHDALEAERPTAVASLWHKSLPFVALAAGWWIGSRR